MRKPKSRASTILPLILFLSVSSCSSSNSGTAERVSATIPSVITPTSLPDWKQKQLDEEQERIARITYWDQNNVLFLKAVQLSTPESGSDSDLILALARDLAEAKGAVAQFRRSEFEVVRSVVANFVSERAVAFEDLLDAISASDQGKGLKAFAQIEYLDKLQDKITLCVIQNNLNC